MEPTLTNCKNCGKTFTGQYCNHCGEKVYHEHDRSLLHFFEEGFHFVTHFDGKFFNTVKTIFMRPGQLSVDYCYGIRKRYFKPLSLFLLLVVIYLLFPAFEALNMKLRYHMHSFYGGYATRMVSEIMQTHHLTADQLSEAFAHKSEKVSKFLLVLLIPLTALFLWPFTFRKRRYFFDQMVFSAELNSFFLLWGFLLMPFLFFSSQWIYHKVSGIYLLFSDSAIAAIVYLVFCIFLAVAARRFYKLNLIQSIALSLLFYFVHEIIVQGLYKFLLFVLAIHQIH